jgi:hypothetical protein
VQVCPVTLECAGTGYELTLPKDWVTKYGPALQMGLTVIKVACGVGRLAGDPNLCMHRYPCTHVHQKDLRLTMGCARRAADPDHG